MATSPSVELRFQELSLSERHINPGLLHLSINLNFQPDSETLYYRKLLLEMKLKEEHVTNHLVIQNLIALANHRLPRRQRDVRKILEGIIKMHPKHLNTLAYLEIIYKELHRHKESDRCKQLKEDILRSNEPSDIELKAQCVLEQGYALINEEATNHEGIANQKLRDSMKILSNEHQRSEGKRKENLGHALRHAEQATSCVLNAMFCDRPDEKMQRKRDGIEHLICGINMLESIGKTSDIEYKIWKFCLGIAYNRFDYSVYQLEDTAEKDEARSELCGTVLQIFWDTISNLGRNRKYALYIGRSYAYIGHLIISRPDVVEELEKSASFDCFKTKQFISLLRNPLSCFEKAIQIRPDDVHILNRYGRSLRNMSMLPRNTVETKYQLLYDAYEILSKSILILPHSNWFAYVTRMQTCRDIATYDEMGVMQNWLEIARQDGIQCFNTKATDADLSILAKICQMLAKSPNISRYGPKFVTNKEYIHEAIQYLNYALQLGGFVSWNVVYTLGTCLYEIEEYRTAVEWMKRAMYFSRSTVKPNSLTRIGEYLIVFYKSELEEGRSTPTYLLDELRFCIALGKSKYSEINPSISDLCKYHRDGMMEFTEHLLGKSDAFSRELAELCIHYLKEWTQDPRKVDKIGNLSAKLAILPSPKSYSDVDLPSSSEFITPDIVMPFSVDATVQNSSYKYDFFVSHSNVNGDWVKAVLLHQLETKLHEDDTAFKGCIADRDFTPGKTIIANILEAVADSHKVIMIITEEFIKSRWCDYEVDKALMEMLNNKKEDCIIPVLLEEVNIPRKINHITYLDLTDKTKQLQEIMKLKRGLSIDIPSTVLI